MINRKNNNFCPKKKKNYLYFKKISRMKIKNNFLIKIIKRKNKNFYLKKKKNYLYFKKIFKIKMKIKTNFLIKIIRMICSV